MNYARIAQRVAAKIRKAGTKCVLRLPDGESTYDADTVTNEVVYHEYTGYGVVTSFDAASIDGTIIKATDMLLLCTLPVKPESAVGLIDMYDKTGRLTGTYSVLSVKAIEPDNTTAIAYKIQLRK